MALAHSLFTGASGLMGHQKRLDATGHNLSNINTVGFKKGQHRFADLFGRMLAGPTAPADELGGQNVTQIGLGTSTGAVTPVYTQGGFQTTGRTLDCAIEGDSFFAVGGTDASAPTYLTRDGSFYLGSAPETGGAPAEGEDGAAEADGAPKPLLAGDGMHVFGYQADQLGSLTGAPLTQLAIPLGQAIDGKATETASLEGNLNSDVTVNAPTRIDRAADPTWVSDQGARLNLGHVQTSTALTIGGAPASATTDLRNLEYVNSAGQSETLFRGLQPGDEIEIAFTRGGADETATFVYYNKGVQLQADTDGDGELEVEKTGSGTTLEDLATFLTGGLGDDGAPDTERLDGGAFGTVRTRERTVADDGYEADAQHAGAYLRDVGGQTLLSIGSNLGDTNAITEIAFRHGDVLQDDLFAADPLYGEADGGGSVRQEVTVYDEAGDPKTLDLSWALVERGDGTSLWRWMAYGEDEAGERLTGLRNENWGSGYLRFGHVTRTDADGNVVTDEDGDPVVEPGVLEATQDASRALGADADPLTFDMSGLTQVAAADAVGVEEQDGWAPGVLEDFTIAPDGVVQGRYSNGVNRALAQIALARVSNPNGMDTLGENLLLPNGASGEATYSTVGGENFLYGQIRSGALELSNVEAEEEMTNLITTQRGYQANARMVTTTDEMLQSLLALKR